jgi:hypothetical protein
MKKTTILTNRICGGEEQKRILPCFRRIFKFFTEWNSMEHGLLSGSKDNGIEY